MDVASGGEAGILSGLNQQWRYNATGSIVGVESGLCLDVTGAATGNGTKVELWQCTGSVNQKWTR